jgi:hypothetical protein
MDNTNTNITIQDLATIHNLIDVACSRGAFKADEASQVGEVYDKLTHFLSVAIAQAQSSEQVPPAE